MNRLQGVEYRVDRGTYRCAISINGKKVKVGSFSTAEEAHAKYLELRTEYPAQVQEKKERNPKIRVSKREELSTKYEGKMPVKQIPSQEYLSGIYFYDRESGVLHRKVSNLPQLSKANGSKYFRTKVHGTWFRVHRIIWKLIFNEEPQIIDHIDHDPTNNRLNNLRTATPEQSSANRRIQIPTVYCIGSKFGIRIYKDRKTMRLGTFATVEEAHEAYKNKHIELYGDFSPYKSPSV